MSQTWMGSVGLEKAGWGDCIDINERWMSNGAQLNEAQMSHVTDMNMGSVGMVKAGWGDGTDMNELWMSHGTQLNEARMSHVTDMNMGAAVCCTVQHTAAPIFISVTWQCNTLWCNVLQYVAVCCSVLQCLRVCCTRHNENKHFWWSQFNTAYEWVMSHIWCCTVLQCVAVCCSVLQYAAVCCTVLQYVAVCCSVLQRLAACCTRHNENKHFWVGGHNPIPHMNESCRTYDAALCCSVLQCAALCCTVLHCVALCCSVLSHVAVCCSVL